MNEVELMKFLPQNEQLPLNADLAYQFIVIYNRIIEPNPENYKWETPNMTEIFNDFEISSSKVPTWDKNSVWFYTGEEECNSYAFLKHIRNAIVHDSIRTYEEDCTVTDFWYRNCNQSSIVAQADCSMTLTIPTTVFWPLIVKILNTLKTLNNNQNDYD